MRTLSVFLSKIALPVIWVGLIPVYLVAAILHVSFGWLCLILLAASGVIVWLCRNIDPSVLGNPPGVAKVHSSYIFVHSGLAKTFFTYVISPIFWFFPYVVAFYDDDRTLSVLDLAVCSYIMAIPHALILVDVMTRWLSRKAAAAPH